jgi:predicted NBD/HSP70 family sugar kinase
LGQVTGLARSTVAQRIDALKIAGLIVEPGDAAPSTGGRPPSLLGFNGDAGLVLAADLGATRSRVSVSNLLAKPIADITAEIDINEGPVEVLAWLKQTFEDLLQEIGRPMSEVRGVGIGLPGPVDFVHGMAVNPPIMAGWHMFPVAEHCRTVFGVPVLVDNDVNIMALGEYWVMEPKVEDFVFVKVGTGIGSGLILGGNLHRGAKGAAGDMGHVRTTSDDVLCRCGNNGCLEATAGGAAIASQLREQGHEASTSRDVVKLVQKGNRDAIRAVRAAGRLIGQVLASTVNLLNPALIMVGGDMARAEPQLLAGIREVVYQRSTTLSTTDLQIVVSSLGDHAGITGAAAMVIEHILTPSAVDHVLAGG